MSTVSVRDLRNRGGDVLARVRLGESITVTSDGARVAELRPLHLARVSTAELVDRRRTLPSVDLDEMRNDADAILDPSL